MTISQSPRWRWWFYLTKCPEQFTIMQNRKNVNQSKTDYIRRAGTTGCLTIFAWKMTEMIHLLSKCSISYRYIFSRLLLLCMSVKQHKKIIWRYKQCFSNEQYVNILVCIQTFGKTQSWIQHGWGERSERSGTTAVSGRGKSLMRQQSPSQEAYAVSCWPLPRTQQCFPPCFIFAGWEHLWYYEVTVRI